MDFLNNQQYFPAGGNQYHLTPRWLPTMKIWSRSHLQDNLQHLQHPAQPEKMRLLAHLFHSLHVSLSPPPNQTESSTFRIVFSCSDLGPKFLVFTQLF